MLKDKQYTKVNTENYPMMTSDEERHGFILYPGQSIVFEINVSPEDSKIFGLGRGNSLKTPLASLC